MKILVLLLLILNISTRTKCQSLKQDVQNNSNEITINTNDTLFDDLADFGKTVKNSQVVMLGEQEHGDGTTFLAKTRLIKFLHEKMGFNIIAFESDFISLDIAWSNVLKDKSLINKTLYSNIYPVWTKCQQCQEVFKYIESESNKKTTLNVAGFDNQLRGVTAFKQLKNLLLDSIAILNSEFYLDKKNDFSMQLDTVTDLLSGKKVLNSFMLQNFYESFIKNLSILELFLERNKPPNYKFTIFTKSIKSYYIQLLFSLKGKDFESGQERDSQMAANLNWLIQYKYPNEKIIVWAANSHIIKNYQQEINKKYRSPFSMGQLLTQIPETSNKVYIVGFTGYTGNSSRAFGEQSVIKISKPKKNSLEEWINETKKENVFVDFIKLRNSYKNEKFFMNFKNWFHEKSDWLNSYDGIIYIEKISPCEIINN